MIRQFRPTLGLGRKKKSSAEPLIPTRDCPGFKRRTGALAHIDRCQHCNAFEDAHKPKPPMPTPRFRRAKEQFWWLLRDVASDSGWSLRSRLVVLKDAVAALKILHEVGRSYGATLRATAIMVGEDGSGGLRRPIPMPAKLDPHSLPHGNRCREDMLRFGKVMNLLLDEKMLSEQDSLKFLRDQLLSDDAENRPDALGTEEWIADVLQQAGGRPTEPPRFASSRHPFYGFIDLISEESADDDDLDGYESDDSYMPEPRGRDDAEVDGANKSDTDQDSVNSNVETTSDPANSMTRTNSHGSKLNMFLSEVASTESEAMPQSRRRSASDDASSPVETQGSKNSSIIEGLLSARANKKRPSSGTFRPLSSATKNDFRVSWGKRQTRKMSLAAPSPKQVAERFDRQERLTDEEAMALVSQAEMILQRESNLLEINDSGSVQVFGDIHGQYFDIRFALQESNYSLDDDEDVPSPTLVFLGDYVDRGAWSCEVLFFVLALKVARPSRVFLLRGNHESSAVVSFFGFKEEIEAKYGLALFHRCVTCFQAMPLSAIVSTAETKWMLCHGGISANLTSLNDIKLVTRLAEPGMNGLLCDLLWADPLEEKEDDHLVDFLPNPSRGCSVRFGREAIVRFLDQNELNGLIRGHEVKEQGYEFQYEGRVVTVFSAPNYCGRYGNKAAYLMIDHDGSSPLRAVQYDSAPDQPEPVVFESVTKAMTDTISTTLPFMPTTLDGFVTRALQLWTASAVKEAQEELSRQNAVSISTPTERGNVVAVSPAKASPIKEKHQSPDVIATDGANDDDNSKIHDAEQVEDADGDTDEEDEDDNEAEEHESKPSPTNAPHSLPAVSPFQRAKKKLARALRKMSAFSSFSSKFQTAKLSDGINEAHPRAFQHRLESAEIGLRMRISRHMSESNIFASGGENDSPKLDLLGVPLSVRYSDLARAGFVNGQQRTPPALGAPFPPDDGNGPLGAIAEGSEASFLSRDGPKSSPSNPQGEGGNLSELSEFDSMPLYQLKSRVRFDDDVHSEPNGLEGPNMAKQMHDQNLSLMDTGGLNLSINASQNLDSTLNDTIDLVTKIPERNAFDISVDISSPSAPDRFAMPSPSTSNVKSPRTPYGGYNHRTFTEAELHYLELLFLLVDRTDDGKISSEEVLAWSRDEDGRVSEEDAKRVVEAVDADLDGFIGLDDWLWFAHCCREMWIEENNDPKSAPLTLPASVESSRIARSSLASHDEIL